MKGRLSALYAAVASSTRTTRPAIPIAIGWRGRDSVTASTLSLRAPRGGRRRGQRDDQRRVGDRDGDSPFDSAEIEVEPRPVTAGPAEFGELLRQEPQHPVDDLGAIREVRRQRTQPGDVVAQCRPGVAEQPRGGTG